MKNSELFYLLALIRTEGIGDITARKLLVKFKSAEQIFNSSFSEINEISRIPKKSILNIINKSSFDSTEKELNFINKNNIHVYYSEDTNYPTQLKQCPDAPLVIFSSNKLNFHSRKIISIVGTRNITNYGSNFCKELIADLAFLNPIIVSGFALGTDICAHLSSLENNLETFGVLAHGLDRTYPPAHKKYVDKMNQKGGFISEFWSNTFPDKENFVKRNRIVAGISDATIVIESAQKGGSLITANLANDYSRDVFAVPGRINDKYSIGCNNLIKTQKAHLLTCTEDILYIMNWTEKPKLKQPQLFINLNHEEQKIYDYLNINGKESLDFLAKNTKNSIPKTASILFDLEMKGIIKALPGKNYEIN